MMSYNNLSTDMTALDSNPMPSNTETAHRQQEPRKVTGKQSTAKQNRSDKRQQLHTHRSKQRQVRNSPAPTRQCSVNSLSQTNLHCYGLRPQRRKALLALMKFQTVHQQKPAPPATQHHLRHKTYRVCQAYQPWRYPEYTLAGRPYFSKTIKP